MRTDTSGYPFLRRRTNAAVLRSHVNAPTASFEHLEAQPTTLQSYYHRIVDYAVDHIDTNRLAYRLGMDHSQAGTKLYDYQALLSKYC